MPKWTPKGEKLCEGLYTYETLRGWRVLSLHWTADPDKDEEWYAEMLRNYSDITSFMREFEIDWSATTGRAFYSYFVRRNAKEPTYYAPERGLKILPHPVPIHRGWDFGIRHPAVVFGQLSKSGRLGIVRELMGNNIDPYSFRDLVKFVSGEIPIDDLKRRPAALEHVHKLEEQGHTLPWFPLGTKFHDYGSPEATKIRDIDIEKEERNDYEILMEGGVDIMLLPQRVSAGTYILRRLLLPHPDGKGPSILIDRKYCPIIFGGFSGGFTFKKDTPTQIDPEEPAKDGWFEHLHDALRYLVVGMSTIFEFEFGFLESNDIYSDEETEQDLRLPQESDYFMDIKKAEEEREKPGVYTRYDEYESGAHWG